MSAYPSDERDSSSSDGSAEPLYLASGDHALFGWLHRPAGQAGALGLVICNPFGYESIAAHRSLRAIAEAAAGVGIPALRFDYAGTGDAQDLEPGATELEAWPHDVLAAVGELQRRTRVERVCLLGLRLGAALAVQAACESKVVSGLIAVAPVISGRRYLRELRTAKLAAARGRSQAPLVGPAGASEFSGFMLSAASLEAIAQLDLMSLSSAPALDILVIDRSDLPGARAWSEQLSGLGVRVQHNVLAGLVELFMTAPYISVTPVQLLAEICDWLKRLQVAAAPSLPAIPPALTRHAPWRPEPESSLLRLPATISSPNAILTERAVFFHTAPRLFGVITEPQSTEVRRRGVILLNDGATHHIGANRANVALAREWGRRGYFVLRMDLAGLGDSDTRPGRPDDEVFPPAALDDLRAAVQFIRQQYEIRNVTLVGLCSGGYHALRAAVAGIQVDRIMMVNPQNYFWKDGMTLDELQEAEVVSNASVYRDRVLSLASWKRLLGGHVNIWRIAKIFVNRGWFAIESTLRDAARALRIRLPRDLGWDLEAIVARGIRVVFVFSEYEPGIDLLRLKGGSSVKRLGNRCRVHIIEGADHVFSRSSDRAVLERVLSDELFARHLRSNAAEGAAADMGNWQRN
jgi:alpha-beta hydrolase superfamily lysophospholipase